jgi:hypothetical protein
VNDLDGTRNIYVGETRNALKLLVGCLEWRDHLVDLGLDGNITSMKVRFALSIQ